MSIFMNEFYVYILMLLTMVLINLTV